MSQPEIPREIPKGRPQNDKGGKVDSGQSAGNFREEALQEMGQGPGARATDASAFRESSGAKAEKPVNLLTQVSDLAKDLTKMDYRNPEAAKLTNQKLAQTAESVLKVASGNRTEAVTTLAAVVGESMKLAQGHFNDVKQRHDDMVASLPPSEQQAYKDRLQYLLRADKS